MMRILITILALCFAKPCYAIEELIVTTTSLGTLTQGVTSAGTLTATGGSANYVWEAIDSRLDFTLSMDGSYSITPETYGSYNWTVRVDDGTGNTGSKVFTGSIEPGEDVDLPEVLEFTMPATASSLTVPVTTFVGDVTAIAYMVTQYPAKVSKNDDRWIGIPWTEVTSSIDGSVTFYSWVKNRNGDVVMGPTATTLITVDPGDIPTPPEVVDFPELVPGDKGLSINND